MSQMTMDDLAADYADKMLASDKPKPGAGYMAKGGAAGDMPTSRPGESGAEGGFTPEAGGQVIDTKKGSGEPMDMTKAGQTGSNTTNEPGRQGMEPYTTDDVTKEPKGEESKAKPGTPGLDQSADDDSGHRQRKPGQFGIPNQEGTGGQPGTGKGANLGQNEDNVSRGRKAGQFGISKADEDEDDEDGDDNDMAYSKGKKAMKKSDVEFDAEDLIKSLETLEAIGSGSTIPASAERRAELGSKLADGTISKSEQGELGDLLKAAAELPEQGEPLQKSDPIGELSKSSQEVFAEDATLQEGYDVSPFLERHSQLTAAQIDQVQTTLAKSIEGHRDHQTAYNTQLAKSLQGMAKLAQSQGALVKSLVERLDTVEAQPMPRRGVSNVRALHKSMDGEAGAGAAAALSRPQIFTALEQMAMRGDTAPCGEPLMNAVAMFENSGKLSKSLHADCVDFHQGNRAVQVGR